jgi:plasmid stabilization system protein ParE
MAYRIELTSRAESDAYQAYEYIRHYAPERAEKWLRGLFEAIFTLDEMPRRCTIVPESEEIGREIRQLLYGKRTGIYRIVFDVQENAVDGPLVRVLRIWHGARDTLHSEDLTTD